MLNRLQAPVIGRAAGGEANNKPCARQGRDNPSGKVKTESKRTQLGTLLGNRAIYFTWKVSGKSSKQGERLD